MRLTILDLARHRNGICGAPFAVILFEDAGPEGSRKVALLFEQEGHCAVLDVDKLAKGNIAFGSIPGAATASSSLSARPSALLQPQAIGVSSTMTHYNVHIYREMRLFFPGIEAATPDDAARIAANKPTADAEYTEDCDGENLSALVDLVGDDEFENSVTIDFDHERLRKAAPGLLKALKGCFYALDENEDGYGPSKQTAIQRARAAIAEAVAQDCDGSQS